MGEDQGVQTPPWINSMTMILGSLHNQHVEACGISIVPEQLRKLKMEAYMPKIFSIGPLHKGIRRDLQYMEEIKWRCMLYLLHRARPVEKVIESFNKCSEAILGFDEVVASYNVNHIEFNNHDLAKIMVLDGCFLLELLISGSEHLNCRLECTLLDYASAAAKVIRREEVLSDLIRLENQIPLLVLNILSKLLFPHVFTEEDGGKLIHDLALSLLGYTPGTNFNGVSDFIGLVHRSFIDKEERKCLPNTVGSDEPEGIQGNKDHSISMARDDDAKMSHKYLKLKRCATSLHAAGVIIKPPATEANNVELAKKNPTPKEIRFDLNIRFHDRVLKNRVLKNGVLEIPPMHITETTEDKWRNFIAWEVNRTDMQSFISRGGDPRTECKFISYALFFQSLICCVEDIQLLRDKKVIVVHERNKEGKMKAMSNNDLVTFFRELTNGIPDDLNYVDPSFRELLNALNSHPRAWCNPTIIWHTFRYYLITLFTDLLRIFTRDHRQWKIMGTLGIVLTAIQTYYSIRGK